MSVALAYATRRYQTASVMPVATTVPDVANRVLVVKVAVRAGGSVPTVSSVTFDGTALTDTDSAAASMMVTTGGVIRVHTWKLVAPHTGSGVTLITLSSSASMLALVEVYSGANQTTPLGAVATATGSSTTPSVTVTSTTADLVTDIALANALETWTVGSGQTLIWDAGAAGTFDVATSYETGAASTVMSWTINDAATWASLGVPIIAAAAPAGPLDPSITISEIRVLPLRGAPELSANSGTDAQIENLQARREASGLFGKVLRARVAGDTLIVDDIYTLPSVAPVGAIAVSACPAKGSPRASLVCTTQNALVQYPLPYSVEPSLTDYPRLANDGSDPSAITDDLLPVMYFAGRDLTAMYGDELFRLDAIDVFMENMVPHTDYVSISARFDETQPWTTAERLTGEVMQFTDCASAGVGRTLYVAMTIHDGLTSEPVGPVCVKVIAHVSAVPVDISAWPVQQARAAVEVT